MSLKTPPNHFQYSVATCECLVIKKVFRSCENLGSYRSPYRRHVSQNTCSNPVSIVESDKAVGKMLTEARAQPVPRRLRHAHFPTADRIGKNQHRPALGPSRLAVPPGLLSVGTGRHHPNLSWSSVCVCWCRSSGCVCWWIAAWLLDSACTQRYIRVHEMTKTRARARQNSFNIKNKKHYGLMQFLSVVPFYRGCA